MSFLILKIFSGNSEEDQYFILPNCSLVIELQFGNISRILIFFRISTDSFQNQKRHFSDSF
jgi:hypothetical protein